MRDLYSKRNKQPSEILEYEKISEKLKVQIIRIWERFFEQLYNETNKEKLWEKINSFICDEHGKHTLYDGGLIRYLPSYKCKMYFENLDNIMECFDVIEIVFRAIAKTPTIFSDINYSFTPVDTIVELNERFKENDFGYEYVENKILRVDNKLLHSILINKTLDLTLNTVFENANDEFLSALEHFKNGKNKEALNDCLKSFESTMKIICTEFNWLYTEKDTSSKLIQICFENELIPKYLQNHFSGLRTTLESGIPTIRNKRGGHGQGPKKIIVPNNLAAYTIYLTGACINYLIELYNERKKEPNR